ncbi:hypothetical protein EKD04_017460 [Chloroflexales bacterium ZM16-3]|nr:hypothetical protein [Chloroflexales bacterium ZM16-3]
MSYTVSTEQTHPAVQQLGRCIEYLRSVCDGAVARDNVGFSAFDKNLGHYLADRLADHAGWSRQDLGFAVQIAWRYREQLGRAGLTFPTAAELQAELGGADLVQVVPTASTATVRLWPDAGGWLSLQFSHYDHALLAQLISTVPDADRWWDNDGTRWLIEPAHTGMLVALYGVAVEDAPVGQVAVAPPTARKPNGRAEPLLVEITDHDDRRIAVRCPFSMKDLLKAAVPYRARAWDGATKTWLVDRSFHDAVSQALGL